MATFHVVDVLTGTYLGDPMIGGNGWFLPVPEAMPSIYVPSLPILPRDVVRRDEGREIVLHLACREDVVTETGDGPLVTESRVWDADRGAVILTRVRSMPPLADQQAAKVAAVNVERDQRLARGWGHSSGLHVAATDDSRADLTAMGATAGLAIQSLVPWPASYAEGWISVENVRIPLPTPQDGLTLAAAVGDWYARTVQHARDLKDAALAATDQAALDAVDAGSGWPEAEA